MSRDAGWMDRAIPLCLYGDAARFARTDSLEIVAFSFLLSREATWAQRLVTAGFVKSAEWGRDTWYRIWDVMVWSFNALYEGRHPPQMHDGADWPVGSYGAAVAGRPLSSGGLFAVVHRVVGDLDYFHKRLGLRVAPNGNRPCEWCDAGRNAPHPPFLHLQPHAAWIATVHTPPAARPSDHPIWGIVGLGKFSVGLDLMHTFDLGFWLTSKHRFFIAWCITMVWPARLKIEKTSCGAT